MEKKSARAGLRRAVSLVLALVMALSVSLLPAAAVTQQDIANLKSKAQSLNSQKAQIQSQINSLANSKSNAMQKKQLLEQKINVLRDQIAVSEQTISSLTVQIEQKEKELAEAKAEEERYFNLFCERVRSMEEDGEISYWEVMFQAKTFSQLLDQVNKVGEIMDYDNEIMDQLEAAREAVAKAKSELEQSKREEEAARNALQSQKAELDAEVGQVNSLIAQINNQSAAYANQMEDLNASASEIDRQITAVAEAILIDLILARKGSQLAVAVAGAGQAVHAVIRKDQLQRGLSGGDDLRGIGEDFHAVADRINAGRDEATHRAAAFGAFNKTDAAGADGVDVFQIAKGGNTDAGETRGFDDR